MNVSVGTRFGRFRLGVLAGCMVLVAALTLGGCAGGNLNLRGAGFPEGDWTREPGQYRRTHAEGPPIAYSNKAREIARNLGAR